MEKSQAEIQAKKLRERGKRLWYNYRWTNEMYDALFEFQGGRCAGCGRPPKNAPLNVDHVHFHVVAERVRITGIFQAQAIGSRKWWRATVQEYPDIQCYGTTKADSIAQARSKALPRSVRGLLCPGRQRGCNRLLGRIDNVTLLRAFVRYLENPPAKQILDRFKKS